MPQANFTEGAQPPYYIHLYTVNPVTARATSALIQGAVENTNVDVSGFAYCPSVGKILMATESSSDINVNVTYKFYWVDPATAVAHLTSVYESPDGSDTWVGWFHELSHVRILKINILTFPPQ